MIRSMFSGVAGLRTHQSKMDVIGNNIANVNTYGYKAMRTTFKESIYSTSRNSTDGGTTFGGMNASQVGYGSQIGSVDLLFTSGSYAPTDSPTDCMIDGNGMFLLGTKDIAGDDGIELEEGKGDISKLLMSRVGDLKLDGQGYLVNSDGYHVYGFQGLAPDEQLGLADGDSPVNKEALKPIQLPLDDEGKPMNIGAISIDANGMVTGIVSGSGDGADDEFKGKVIVIGQIAVANVPNSNGLQKTQGPYYKAVANTGEISAHAPGDGNTGRLITNGLEMANVDLAREFSDMITTQRGFQANTRIITVSDQMLEEMMAMKR